MGWGGGVGGMKTGKVTKDTNQFDHEEEALPGGVLSHQWTSLVRIRLSSFDPLIESARMELHASVIVRSRSLSRSLSAHVLPARPIRSLRRVQWGRSLAAGRHQGALKAVSLKKEPTEALLVLLTSS